MRITVIPQDKFIAIDEESLFNVREDMTWIPSNIHAIQWYETWGEIEYMDGKENEKIQDLGVYKKILTIFENEKLRIENERLEEIERIENETDWWEELRFIRNEKLNLSDWSMMIDSPLSESDKNEWKIYRQYLRDLPENIEDPKSLVKDLQNSSWGNPPAGG